MGAWIEILSAPTAFEESVVAPLVGAWIEIRIVFHVILICEVAPLVGAWIEIVQLRLIYSPVWSLPSWERGLKLRISDA